MHMKFEYQAMQTKTLEDKLEMQTNKLEDKIEMQTNKLEMQTKQLDAMKNTLDSIASLLKPSEK